MKLDFSLEKSLKLFLYNEVSYVYKITWKFPCKFIKRFLVYFETKKRTVKVNFSNQICI